MIERNLTLEDAVQRFISKRRDKNTDKTVRSYETGLRQFVSWAHERDELGVMRDLDSWLIDECERFTEASSRWTVVHI